VVKTLPSIRVAEPDDLDELLGLDQVARSSPARQTFLRTPVMDGVCHVALVDGRPVGYLVLDYTFFESGFISLVYVAEKHRRSGIGTALIKIAERVCRTSKLFTSTNASNTAMRNLLIVQGYMPSGIVENLDENDPELIFFKRLPNRSCAE
jgi:GNAT superfamily N-acetyltransferase